MLAVYVVPLAALAYGYDAVVGPAESGWLEVLSALPVTRTRILAGTTLGRGVVLVGGVALGFLIPGAILVSEYGTSTVPALATLLLAAAALGLAFLAVAVALSTLVREKTHALGVALLAWVWFVLVHDLLALGVVAAFDLSEGAVTALVLANPTSVYRVLVLGELGAGGTGGFASVLSAAGLSTRLLAVALAAWVVVPVVAAAALVRWRGTIAAT
jgi:Cu-processing system permease protein